MTARGTLIAFAADEGQDAKDNYKDALSLFTTFLVSELSKPDLPLCALFEAIRRSVDSASFQAQTPFVYDGIIGNFIFNHQTDAEAVRRVETLGGNQLPKKVLATVAAEKDPNTVAAFIARYPNSSSAGKAKGILTDLMSSTTTAAGVLPLQINDDLRGENLDADTNYRLVAEAADRAYKAGDYGRALNGYRKLANTKQDDGWITYNLANCELQLKQYGDAIKTFDTAIALKPDNPWAYYNRGVAHHLSGNLSAAIKDYKKALQLMPLYAAGYNNLAIAERESGDLKSAEIDASKSIELDPNYATAYFNRSVIYSIQNRKVAAQQDLNRGNALTIPKKVG